MRRLSLAFYLIFSLFLGIAMGIAYRFYGDMLIFKVLNPQGLKFLGSLFISLIKMIVAPLIFASIVSSTVSMSDVKKTGKLTMFALTTFFVMTFVSVLVGLFFVYKIKPGRNVVFDRDSIIESSTHNFSNHAIKTSSFGDFVMNFVPSNIFEAFLKDDFLKIIFFAVFFGLVVAGLPIRERVRAGICGFADIMSAMSRKITNVAPLGVFGLSYWLCGTQDIKLLLSLGMLTLSIYASCIFVMYGLYSLFLIFVLRLNPYHFFRKMAPVQFLGFLLASSSAVLPSSLEIAEKKLGVPKDKADFIIPMGATLNMNGGAVYLGSVTVFIAQLWGIDLSFGQLAMVVILATFGAVGTAPIPGSAIFLLAGILASVDLPIEAVAIVFAIDRVLDMMRTVTNITGDVFSALIISRLSGDLSESTYKN